MDVCAPEPSTVMMLGLGMAGFGLLYTILYRIGCKGDPPQ